MSKTYLSYVSLPSHPFQVRRDPQLLRPLLPALPTFFKAPSLGASPFRVTQSLSYSRNLPSNQRKKIANHYEEKGYYRACLLEPKPRSHSYDPGWVCTDRLGALQPLPLQGKTHLSRHQFPKGGERCSETEESTVMHPKAVFTGPSKRRRIPNRKRDRTTFYPTGRRLKELKKEILEAVS